MTETAELHDPTDEELCRGFDKVRDSLHQRPERYAELIRIVNEDERLQNCDFLTEEHRSMLAVLREFDEPTFEHSLRVFSTVREKAESLSAVGIYLRERMHDEGVTVNDLYLAALFHDIGKTAIPTEVLHNSLSQREWAKLANRYALKNGEQPPYSADLLESTTDEGLDEYFQKTGRPIEKVPALEAFSPHDIQVLKEHGISVSQPFLRILALHERATRVILTEAGMNAVAELAGNHHGYTLRKPQEGEPTTSVSALRTGYLETLLRSADIFDALIALDREYRKAYTPLQALACLVGFAERGHLEAALTRLWIADELDKLSPEDRAGSSADRPALGRIQTFLRR